jgi:hypothetical protein
VIKQLAISGKLYAAHLTASTRTRSFYFSTEDSIIRASNKDGKYMENVRIKTIHHSTITRRITQVNRRRFHRIRLLSISLKDFRRIKAESDLSFLFV